ncbi:hypothetical protein GCM10008986_08170 [Salinibacillus aidingensis]|uniref:MmgE/PrpD C-terminal domain-containing protein n=1 Tax=Salinibacillus aidingensis TaxID=237684 RepID=A0ABP3KU38_9BACI
MIIQENEAYTKDYLDPNKRSIANAVQVFYTDGTATENVASEYPLGHRFRREEAIPKIRKKYKDNLSTKFTKKQVEKIEAVSYDYQKLSAMDVNKFVDLFLT